MLTEGVSCYTKRKAVLYFPRKKRFCVLQKGSAHYREKEVLYFTKRMGLRAKIRGGKNSERRGGRSVQKCNFNSSCTNP